MDLIANASDRIAHVVLLALCEDPAILDHAVTLLQRLEEREANPNGAKRRAEDAQLLVCLHCEEPFIEAENSAMSCRYHEGKLEPDYESEIWADHDESIHGPVDSDASRKAYPEGFFWNCCGRHGEEDEPCMQGRHVAPSYMKRGRFDDNGDSGSGEDDEDDYGEDQSEGSGGATEGAPVNLRVQEDEDEDVEEEEEDDDDDDGDDDEGEEEEYSEEEDDQGAEAQEESGEEDAGE